MKIYNELESLGFLEWLNDIKFGCSHTNLMLLDAQPFDSIERSGYNAIAFRWFREKYKLKADVTHATSNGGYTYTIWKWNFDNTVGKWERIGVINSWFTYEEAELECLKKLIKITQNTNK